MVSIGSRILEGKGKLSHLLGTGPKKRDPGFETWDEQDSVVMSWLWTSDIWEAVKQTYSKVRVAAQMYEIKTKTSSTKQ